MKPRIFLIDADPHDRANFRDAIDVLGVEAELVCADDGTDALEQITSPGFDVPQLMFLDVNMNGLKVLEHLRKDRTFSDMPIIMLYTEYTEMDPSAVRKCFSLGAESCMVKSTWFRPMLSQIRNVIDRYLPYCSLS